MAKLYRVIFFKCVISLLLINGGTQTGEASTIDIELTQINTQLSSYNDESKKYSCGTKQALPCVEKITGTNSAHKSRS